MKKGSVWFEISAVLGVGNLGQVQVVNAQPHREGRPFWVLVLVQKGKRTMYVDDREVRAEAGEFLLIPPYTRQAPLEVDEHTAYFVDFYAQGREVPPPERIDGSRALLPMVGYLPPDWDSFAHLQYLCDHSASPYASPVFLETQLRALLLAISLQCQKNPHPVRKNASANGAGFLSFIKENACRPLRATDYEAAFGLSYHQINLLFRRQFGCTVKQYHARVRMDTAARLLLLGKSVQETAAACGFEDYYFFIRSFTGVHGISPAAYARRHGG